METFTSKSSYELKLIGDFIFNFADVIKNRFLVRKIHTGYVTKLIMSPIVIMFQGGSTGTSFSVIPSFATHRVPSSCYIFSES